MTDENSNTYTIDDFGRRGLISAMIVKLGENMQHANAALPHYVKLYTHDVPGDTFLAVADMYGVEIKTSSDQAWLTNVMVPDTGLHFTMAQILFVATADLTDQFRELIAKHNEHCLADDPAATQPEPATAEGPSQQFQPRWEDSVTPPEPAPATGGYL